MGGNLMRKRILLLLTFSLVMIMTVACSEDKITPNDRFDSYIENWHQYDFEKMYQMLADESLDTFPTEEFVDRYEKIYEDLEITDLIINFAKITNENIDAAIETCETKITFSLEI